MADFKDVINLASLAEHEIGHIEYILNSPAYGDHFKPYLTRMRDSLNKMLLNPDYEREQRYPSDFLRGGIIMVDGLLELFDSLVNETRVERMMRSQVERTPNEQYQQMRADGLVKPSGMTVQPVEPGEYDPAEDY